jgi:hypothetical protein
MRQLSTISGTRPVVESAITTVSRDTVDATMRCNRPS